MEQGSEQDSKEPMESDPDYESGENTTTPKMENTLGRTQEIAPSQEDATPPLVVSDVLGSLTRTLHQLSAVTGLSRDVELPRYDGSYEAQSFFTNYDAQADRAQLKYSTRLRKPPNLLQAPLRVTNTRAYGKTSMLRAVVVKGEKNALLERAWINLLKIDYFAVNQIPSEIAIAEFLKEHQVLFNDTAEPMKGFTFSMNIRDVSPIFHKARPVPFTIRKAVTEAVMVLAGIEGFICYIDDVLIATVSVEKHLAVLKTVFLRLEKYNIKLKKDKCKFVQREIEYLGHLIKEDGIRPLDHKECEEAIEKCKSSITSERILVLYDTTLPLFLATDASQIGIGAVLSHVIGGQVRPIMFASRTLSGAERNYSQIEREALAIIYGVTKFHQFIYGRRFTLITDQKPLVSILGPKSGIPTLSTSRLQRWAIILSAYTYDIKFKKTQDHGNADLLSRLPVESGETSRLDNIYALSYMEDLPITAEEIRIETQKDEVLSIVKCYTQHGWPERVPDHLRPYFQRKLELTVDGECLLWGMRLIIPSSLRPNLLSCLHETHSGMSKMKSVARSHFWWPNLDNEIEFLVNRCRNCQQVQDGPNRVKWQPWIWAVRPWQRIHIDYANNDNINLLIVVDSHSKLIEAFPMREITSAKTIEQLRRLFSSYGLPEEIVSDNGLQFTGHAIKTPHETTKKAPSELFIGRSLRTRLSIIHPNLESRVKEQQARQMKYDHGFQQDEFGIDDMVWCRNFRGGDRWIPGRIVGRKGSRVYTVLIHGQVKSYHRDKIRKRWENGGDEDRQYGRQREETDIIVPEADMPNRGRSESPPIETARQQRDSGLVDQNDGGISVESSRSPDLEASNEGPIPRINPPRNLRPPSRYICSRQDEEMKDSEAKPKDEEMKDSEDQPKGDGVKDSEAKPNGDGVNDSEAKPKGDGVKDSTIESLIRTMANQQRLMMDFLLRNKSGIRVGRPVKMDVAIFDGRNADPKIWFKVYENICGNNGWVGDEARINGMRSYLTGSALLWFDNKFQDEEENCWKDWKQEFICSFNENPIVSYDRAFNWRYRGGSLVEYFYQKQGKMRLGMPGLSDELLIIGIIHGLPQYMQEQLATAGVECKQDLLKLLKNIKPISEKNYSESRPSARTLGTVEKPDHFTESSDTGLLQAANDRNVSFLSKKLTSNLDSGSSLNLIHRNLVQKNRWKTYPTKILINTINHSKFTATEAINLVLEAGEQSIEIQAIVLPDMPFDLLIRKPTLKSLKVKWDFFTDQISFFSETGPNVVTRRDVEAKYPSLCTRTFPMISKFEVDFGLQENFRVVSAKPYQLENTKRNWLNMKIRSMLSEGIIKPSNSAFAFPCILDLKDGFWQLGISENTRKYTAFVTPSGHYEFLKLPFGWKNSPAKFQRIMTTILGDLLDDKVVAYIDDICCGGYTQEDCSILTHKILERLNTAGLVLNLDECQFCVPRIDLLGRVIDGDTNKIRSEVTEKVRNMKRPYNLRSLQCFTGLTNHFRAFIKDYAHIVRPLHKLKGKDVTFEWDSECETAYQKLIALITEEPILRVPDGRLPFELSTDASYYGTGAILYQRDLQEKRCKQLRVIGYYSYTFTKAEQNYSVTEKECLAVLKAVKHFRSYLESRPFVVHTDHQALTQLLSCGELRDRLARWQLFLRSFNIIINHRSGKELRDADALSRLCVSVPDKSDEQTFWLKHKALELKYDEQRKSYLVTPEQVPSILGLYHDDPKSGGHSGFWRTYYTIKNRFWGRNMKGDIRRYVQSCSTCQKVKARYRSTSDQMSLPVQSHVPFHTVHVDFAELKKKSESNASTQSFLVVIDEATRIVYAKCMKQSGKALKEYFTDNPILKNVKKIISDRGTSFTRGEFYNWTQEKGIRFLHTSPYHPAGNGLAERVIQEIKTFMECYPQFPKGWKCCLEAAGTVPIVPADEELGLQLPRIEKENDDKQRHKYRLRTKCYYNRNRRRPTDIKPGDSILVKHQYTGKQRLQTGPHVVTDVKMVDGYVKYVLYESERGTQSAHITNIIKFHHRPPGVPSQE
ncbi:K02A2.6-like [Cordylochernes scorpioides]|uniref:RNA-directed DNA polymerase n=1 Tax=Cordylochernes scorpioides TaxID=51811 RepID=A0ABY6KT22_9ARAC|nr:K02A2.6-like [Cordylochernes scorpioides]